MIYLIGVPASGFVSGILLSNILRTQGIEKQYMLSPVFLTIATTAAAVISIMVSFLLAPSDPLLTLPTPTTLFLSNIFGAFSVSGFVWLFYKVEPFPYVLYTTLIVGIVLPVGIVLISLILRIINEELLFYSILSLVFSWPAVFIWSTFRFAEPLHKRAGENKKTIDEMSEVERFQATMLKTKDDKQ